MLNSVKHIVLISHDPGNQRFNGRYLDEKAPPGLKIDLSLPIKLEGESMCSKISHIVNEINFKFLAYHR